MKSATRHLLAASAVAFGLAAPAFAQTSTQGSAQSSDSWTYNWSWSGGNAVEGSGTAKTDQRKVTGFSAIEASGSWNIVLRQGNSEGVVVQVDDNLLEYFETVVEGQTLKLRTKRGVNLRPKTRPQVTVDFVKLNEVTMGGSNNLQGDNINLDKLRLVMGGSGNIRLDTLRADNLSVSMGGSGGFSGTGSAKVQVFRVGGSGTIRASELAGDDVKISIGGSGSAAVHAKDHLDISIGGSGSVRYKGDPKVSKSIGGSGSVTKM
jgi:hypothetical protein